MAPLLLFIQTTFGISILMNEDVDEIIESAPDGWQRGQAPYN